MEVLVVDDDQGVREALTKALVWAGYEATAVENGLAALALLRARSFGVIACDVRMDFLDGIRLYHELEATYPNVKDRIFFISGVADDPAIADPLQRTGRPVLRKPFDLEDFLDLVHEIAWPSWET